MEDDPVNKKDPSGHSNTVGSAETKLLQGQLPFETKKHTLSFQQVANIIFNEVRSLSGEGIFMAYMNIASAAWNNDERKAETGVRMEKMASSGAKVPAEEQGNYAEMFEAAIMAMGNRLGDDVTGPFNFNLRKNNWGGPFQGLPKIYSHDGPFKNSYPTDDVPAEGIYVNTYGK